MKISLTSVLYLAFRLAPFIVVTFFVVSYFGYGETQSLLYLIGLILACFVTMLVGGYVSSVDMKRGSMCNLTTLTDLGPISPLPLSIVVYVYTLSYLGIPILHYNRNKSNLPTLIFFPIITFLDIVWLLSFGCSTTFNVFCAGVVGMTIGLAWSEIVFNSSYKEVQYNSILSDAEDCNLTPTGGFRCIQRSNIPTDEPDTISFDGISVSGAYAYLLKAFNKDFSYFKNVYNSLTSLQSPSPSPSPVKAKSPPVKAPAPAPTTVSAPSPNSYI